MELEPHSLVKLHLEYRAISTSAEKAKMAVSSATLGLQYHVRSISLPSRLHPHSIKIEAELNKLKSWEASTTTVPLTAETIRIGLVGLAELYTYVEELIHSPQTQQSLFQPQHGVLVEEALEGSASLLDSCGAARDLILLMKEHVQELQSALRRKGGDSSIESNINAYTCFRKIMKKEISKCLRALKQMENRTSSSPLLDADHYLSVVIRILTEVTAITISVLRTFLLFFSASALKTKSGGWSLISKLMLTRSATSKTSEKIFNDAESVDLALQSLHGCFRSHDAKVDVQMARRRLQALDGSIETLEAGLDCLFRCLVQNRVSLLNILVD
ncbi:uncharacterized protein LOC132284312 [Cornus florida]|uniref:uncharacterized protein LOC132284312 n=1 Tax=Cornus florida TaxID=4283 RepID=UPI0028977AEA|nr:uncharacterized protein LOC132284312 [Cornus florida]